MPQFLLIFIGFILLLGTCLGAISFYQTRTVKISHIGDCLPGSLKVMHISDLHINLSRVKCDKLKDAVADIKPDIIAITGDLAEHASDLDCVIDYLKSFCDTTPTFISFGNHDLAAYSKQRNGVKTLSAALNKAGFYSLINGSCNYVKGTKKYNIVLLDDLKNNHGDPARAFLAIDKACPTLALCHNPDTVFLLEPYKPDFVLCGHFHGGQIWLPFKLEYSLLRKEKMLQLGNFRGLCYHNGIPFYINRGLGNVVVPLRLGSFPEIAVIYLNF